MASSAADVPIGGTGMPTAGGDTGAVGAAAGVRVPPFGGDDVIGQLNVWAASVGAKLKASEENKDRSLLLRTEIGMWRRRHRTTCNRSRTLGSQR